MTQSGHPKGNSRTGTEDRQDNMSNSAPSSAIDRSAAASKAGKHMFCPLGPDA